MQTIKSYWDWSPESKVLCIYDFNLCSWKLMNTSWCLHSCKFTVHLWSGSQPPSASQLLLPPHNVEQSDQLFLHTIVARNLSVTHQILEQSQSSLCQRVLASCLQAEPCRARETTNMDNQFLQLVKQPSYIQMHQAWCGKTRKKTSFFFFLSRPERRPINWERNEATGCLEWWDILPTTILQHKCYGCHMAESTRDVGLTDLHQVAEV